MALLNAKRFLTQLEEEAAYRRVISTLLEGVAAHALNLDSDAHLNFCERIGATRRALVAETTVEALLVDAGAAVQAIGDYTREMNCLLRAQDAEMQNMSAMLTGRVAERVSPQPETTDDSSERATPMEDASSGEARVRVYKLTTREGAQRPTPEEDQSQGALHKPVSREKITRRHLSLDPITGLPGHTLAQAQFLSALRTGEPRLVGVFVLDSAQRITLRFGPAMGEEVMRSLKQHLAGLLEASDRMFRWPGPAIVALLTRTDPPERIRARLRRLLEQPIERTFDINSRSVLIPLSIAWSVFVLSPPLAEVNRQIGDFILGRGYRDEEPVPA